QGADRERANRTTGARRRTVFSRRRIPRCRSQHHGYAQVIGGDNILHASQRTIARHALGAARAGSRTASAARLSMASHPIRISAASAAMLVNREFRTGWWHAAREPRRSNVLVVGAAQPTHACRRTAAV